MAAAQSVADTVTMDTRVMRTTLSVPMVTVVVGEGNIVVAVLVVLAVLDVVIGMELEVTIDDVVDSVLVMAVELNEDGVGDKI